MKLTIRNKAELNEWMNERRALGHDLVSLKGTPPKGAQYSDGDLIERPVNIAWQDVTTKEIFAIEYEIPDTEGESDE